MKRALQLSVKGIGHTNPNPMVGAVIVKDGKVIIIDEFTGRMMDGRRYSDGLHQAIEAKEHVRVRMENQTLASITFQNFFSNTCCTSNSIGNFRVMIMITMSLNREWFDI